MKAINATNFIHNLEFLNSCYLPISLASAIQLREIGAGPDRRDVSRKWNIFFADFLNWVRCKPPAPALRRGRASETALILLKWDPIRKWDPISGMGPEIWQIGPVRQMGP
jgi:hypothetical protein